MHPFSRNQRPSAPKVVQIPVHFVNSSKPVDRSGSAINSFKPVDRSGSAIKIQKVLRGFLVRKSMKKIKDVKKQVDEIQEKLSKTETIELIKKDDKERLRVSEGLMSLLIKLDSIGGFDFGVRECRKAVIRKAIALQERVDGIVFVEKVESLDTNCMDGSENDEKLVKCDEKIESLVTHYENDGKLVDFAETNCANQVENDGKSEELESEAIIDVGVDSEVIKVSEENGNKRNNELMDRMVRDNEKMMNMMKLLFDSNEKQMKMINGLSHRVEMLEKALVCDRLRKKKHQQKKRAALCGDD